MRGELGDKLAMRAARTRQGQARRTAAAGTAAETASQVREMIREFLGEWASLENEFGSNVGSRPPVIVNQHFPHPPTRDGHREAKVARMGFRAAFDG